MAGATPQRYVFYFNHIEPTLQRDTVEEIKKKTLSLSPQKTLGLLFRTFQRKNLVCIIVAGKAVISSAVAGGITLNPVVFATLTGFELVVKAAASF